MPIAINDLDKALKTRSATKKFDTSFRLNEQQKRIIFDSANFAPTSFGLQPFKILAIEGSELRTKLKEYCWNQGQITDSSLVLVWASDKNFERVLNNYQLLSQEIRGFSKDDTVSYSRFIKKFVADRSFEGKPFYEEWVKRQAYISLGFVLSSCALIGLDCCPMEGFEIENVNNLLGLSKEGYDACVIMAIGRADNTDSSKVNPKIRKPLPQLIEQF